MFLFSSLQACSSGSSEVVVGNHSDIQLKEYDYFGYCMRLRLFYLLLLSSEGFLYLDLIYINFFFIHQTKTEGLVNLPERNCL